MFIEKYEKEKNVFIFYLPLADYINQKKGLEWITSLQGLEEYYFDLLWDAGDYIYSQDYDYFDEYTAEATAYLKAKGYTAEEIEQYSHVLNKDIKRALAGAFAGNYQYEYLKEYRKMLTENIQENLAELSPEAKLIDYPTADYPDFDPEADVVRFSLSVKEIKKIIAENTPETEAKNAEEYAEALADGLNYGDIDYNVTEVNTEYIDYYGNMGSFDGWMDRFKEDNEIESTVNTHRENEKGKINNFEATALNLKPELDTITDYIDTYITKEPTKSKIKRQVKALKNVIKNAV